jgi:L-amino acid N-acyltransferase YncA
MLITISTMAPCDYPSVSRIYRQGIATGNATFEAAPPASWDDWHKSKIESCSLVARDGDEIVGWAALSPVSSRAVYVGVAEVSVYVDERARGHGVGSRLLQELIRVSEANGFWTLQTGIFPENASSLRLHFRHGFRQVGVRERLGRMGSGPRAGGWRDVLFLERRSRLVGD